MLFKIFELITRNSEIINYYKEHNKEHTTAAGISAILAVSLSLFFGGLITTALAMLAILRMLNDPHSLVRIGVVIAAIGILLLIFHGVAGEWLGNQKSRKEQQESSTEPE